MNFEHFVSSLLSCQCTRSSDQPDKYPRQLFFFAIVKPWNFQIKTPHNRDIFDQYILYRTMYCISSIIGPSLKSKRLVVGVRLVIIIKMIWREKKSASSLHLLPRKAPLENYSPFYLPWKRYFFVRLQIFLHADFNFLDSAGLAPHAKKKMNMVIGVYKFGQDFIIIGIFWKFL